MGGQARAWELFTLGAASVEKDSVPSCEQLHAAPTLAAWPCYQSKFSMQLTGGGVRPKLAPEGREVVEELRAGCRGPAQGARCRLAEDAAQHSTAQHSTAQHSTAQHSTAGTYVAPRELCGCERARGGRAWNQWMPPLVVSPV